MMPYCQIIEMMKNKTQLKTAHLEATITWTFDAHDHVIAEIYLRTKRGRLAHIKRQIELIPRLPQRIKIENVWVGLNLVERKDEVALYASYPNKNGKPQYAVLDQRSKHTPKLRLIHSA